MSPLTQIAIVAAVVIAVKHIMDSTNTPGLYVTLGCIGAAALYAVANFGR